MRSICLSAFLAAGLLAGCGAHTPGTTATVKTAAKQEARIFDRIEATIAHEPGSELAVLEFTYKTLMSKFTDDDVTVFAPLYKNGRDEAQQNLFCSKVFLGQDGHLYLADRAKPNARPRYYEVGTYDAFRQPGDPVKFKFDDGMKLEARNMSPAPVGAGPFMALVVQNRPAPTTSAPNLVRGL